MNWLWTCLRPLTGRFLHSLVTLWLVTVLIFVLTELMPGDFATATATRDTSWEEIQTTRYQLGLFASAPERYLQWLLGLLQGDLGVSWWVQEPITPLIAKRLWHSTWLVAWATTLAVPIALILALLAAAGRGRTFDRLSSMAGIAAISFPEFLVAYALMALLAVYFEVFPVHTTYILDMPLAERLHASGLPILSLAAVTITPIFRQSRAALISVLGAVYVQMAELKGLSRWWILLWHAFPNAAAPIANSVVLAVANLFVGLVIIETIFSYPGMGHLLITGVQLQDVPLVQACALITAVLYIGLVWLADSISIIVNPRLRYPLVPAGGRWIVGRPRSGRFAVPLRIAPLAAVLAILVIAGSFLIWRPSVDDEFDIASTPVPTGFVRDKLTVAALLGDDPDLSDPIHYGYFMPLGIPQQAKHTLQGELRVPRFKVRRRRARGAVSAVDAFFPAFETGLVTEGRVLLPIERDKMLKASSGAWYVILSPGRVWHEPADGDWSRGSYPFTLTGLTHNATYYGIATFVFNDQRMSEVRVQIAQETANRAQFDLWGQSAVTFTPGVVAGAAQAREDYARRAASRLTVRPWVELAARHWRSLEAFDGEGNRHNITVSGLMVDDVFYLRPCRTRAGPHPYCREMRHGVFSIAKTLGAAVSMLWLAQRYGPEVFDEKITDYVTIPAPHDGWKDVTFGQALDMTTGIGTLLPERVDTYVEVDDAPVALRVWRAASVRQKLDAMAAFENYRWGPGEVFRYRSSDTTALSAAMEAFYRTKEGPDADIWDGLTREVFAPLGIDRLPVRRSIEPDGRPGTPLLAAGMYVTVEEALKLARLLQDHGEFDGKQLLHRDLTARTVSHEIDRGFPTGWRYAEGGQAHYEKGIWLTPHHRWFGCSVRIPIMAGFGGNYVVIMPNRTIGLRFADGHDDDPHTWNNYGIRSISERVRPFCE